MDDDNNDGIGNMYDVDRQAEGAGPAEAQEPAGSQPAGGPAETKESDKDAANSDGKKYSSTVEQGTEFEKQVADLMKSYGYNVTHDVTLVGTSGNTHQIDVYAEYKCPMHTSKIIVETKSYKHNLSKDIVMKLMREMEDLGIDRTVLATTSDFSIGAKKEAAAYGTIELWNGDKIKEFMANKGIDTSDAGLLGAAKRFIRAKVNGKRIRKNASKSAKSRSGGAIFGRGKPKESVTQVEMVSYPYLDVSVQTNITRMEKTGWRKRESVTRTVVEHVTLDGRTGVLVDFAKNGPSYRYAYLDSMLDDEMAILHEVAGKQSFGREEISKTGLSSGAASAALLKMAGIGIVKQMGTKPIKYVPKASFPAAPAALRGIGKLFGKGMIDRDPGNRIIDIRARIGDMEESLGRYWNGCKVISVEQVYYPYYDVRYESTDDSKRNEMIDGITGKPQKYLAKIMAAGDDD